MKKVLAITSAILIAALLNIGMWVLGFYTAQPDNPAYSISASILLVILLAIIVINIVILIVRKKHYDKMSFNDIYELGKKMKSKIEQDYLKAQKKVDRLITAGYIYIVVLLAMFTALMYLTGKCGAEWTSSIAGLCVVTSGLMLYCLFVPYREEVPDEQCLSKSKFPQLYSLAQKACDKLGCKGKPYLYVGDDISVTASESRINVFLHPETVSILTSDELYNVFLHEFAHVANVDTKRLARYAKVQTMYNNDWMSIPSLFNSFISSPTKMAIEYYRTFASRYHEIRADDLVNKYGDAQVYTNANAKSEMYKLYTESPNKTMFYTLFQSEKPTDRWCEQNLETFYLIKAEKQSLWEKQMAVELPSFADSHPTFKMRMENAGCTTYDTETTESDPSYIAECSRLLEMGSKKNFKELNTDYKYWRNEFYVKRNEAFDVYNDFKGGKEIRDGQLINSMQNLLFIDNNAVREMADFLIDKSDSPFGHFYLGLVLADNLDDRCVEHFRKAMEKSRQLAPDCIQNIGQFAIRTGNSALLEEYRASVANTLQQTHDSYKNSQWTKKRPLYPTTLDESCRNEIVSAMTSKFFKETNAIYFASYKANGKEMHMVVLELAPGPQTEKKFECIGYFHETVNLSGRDDMVSYTSHFKAPYKAIKKVKGAKVYDKSLQ